MTGEEYGAPILDKNFAFNTDKESCVRRRKAECLKYKQAPAQRNVQGLFYADVMLRLSISCFAVP